MLSIIRFALLLLLFALASCGKNEFTLTFSLPEDVSENYEVTYYAANSNGGVTVQAVASVMKGKCELLGVTKLPALVYVTARNSQYPLTLYVRKGDKLRISGEDRNPLTWVVEGSKINEEISSWRKENMDALVEGDKEKLNEEVAAFVERNQSDPASLILLFTYFKRAEDERLYVRLFNGLKGKAKKRDLLNTMAQASQIGFTELPPARLKSLVMRSNRGYADTVRIGGVQPSFLIFWNHDVTQRRKLNDSIRELVKEFPDSNERIIADIYLDIDSTAWRNDLRRDTLKNITRFWTPLAKADPDVRMFKIPKLPYFIVFDKEGYQNYRGTDISEAMERFRSLYVLPDSVK